MKVAVIGTGYVGLVTGACLAELGHRVTCMDSDTGKISVLRAGGMPIYEEGLAEMVARNVAEGRLTFTDRLEEALGGTEFVFLAVGTPSRSDGSADLSMIMDAAEEVASAMDSPLVIVQKSTCPVGTAAEIERTVSRTLAGRGAPISFAVAVNPEFLREGSAVRDFMQPDRVVVGADDREVARRVGGLYEKIVPPEKIQYMDRASAELTKYAANAFLATKISFINEIANLCEAVGADVEAVRRGMGSDPRIGPSFLAAGIGYGGSCFPKDVKALIRIGQEYKQALQILEAVHQVNRRQRIRQVEKVLRHFTGSAMAKGGSLAGKRIALWGLAFKPGTDDIRDAPSLDVVKRLKTYGAEVVAYDPVAMPYVAEMLGDQVNLAPDALSCVESAHALVLITEWPEFLDADLVEAAGRMCDPVLFDFRNGFDPETAVRAGFQYYAVGRTTVRSKWSAVRLGQAQEVGQCAFL